MSMFFDGFLVITLIVFYIGILIWCAISWTDNLEHKILLSVVCVFAYSFLFGAIVSYEMENPCIQYETQMHYDAVTKTTRPMKVCIERGEWAE